MSRQFAMEQQKKIPKKVIKRLLEDQNCPGFNTNSFLRVFGGMNKGRPNAEDLKHAEDFAQNLKQTLEHPPRELETT